MSEIASDKSESVRRCDAAGVEVDSLYNIDFELRSFVRSFVALQRRCVAALLRCRRCCVVAVVVVVAVALSFALLRCGVVVVVVARCSLLVVRC